MKQGFADSLEERFVMSHDMSPGADFSLPVKVFSEEKLDGYIPACDLVRVHAHESPREVLARLRGFYGDRIKSVQFLESSGVGPSNGTLTSSGQKTKNQEDKQVSLQMIAAIAVVGLAILWTLWR
jgi:hypothetical protein